MPRIYITRKIPGAGVRMLQEKGYEVDVSPKNGALTREEFLGVLRGKEYDAVLCTLLDRIDGEALDAAPTVKIFANYAVGFDNIDLAAVKERSVIVSNTPGVLTNTVAEHTFALMLAIAHRIVEADGFTREGKYKEWAPELLLGNDLFGKTLGIVGAGRIGARVAYHGARGFDMKIIYTDVKPNADIEKEAGAEYREKLEDLLAEADFVSIHVPLLPSTRHLINTERFSQMKSTAYLVNTSRGPVVDEVALVEALRNKTIRGAALDVFENEPALAPGLAGLANVIITPHIASGTEETRAAMAELAAKNIIAVLEGGEAPTAIKG
ncbi:MAG: D-glycerate dehydrogenase [Parcubacteria group bacterium]|nr:D-glycerate dehydrogenase [Parcubacteria group bacterium]